MFVHIFSLYTLNNSFVKFMFLEETDRCSTHVMEPQVGKVVASKVHPSLLKQELNKRALWLE